MFSDKKTELIPDCPQVESDYWEKYTEKYLFDNPERSSGLVKKENIYLEPVDYGSDHDYVDIEALQKQQQNTDLDDENYIYHNVENLRIDPVRPFVEPYEREMRKDREYQASYDCYYDTHNRILSDEENKRKRLVLIKLDQ